MKLKLSNTTMKTRGKRERNINDTAANYKADKYGSPQGSISYWHFIYTALFHCMTIPFYKVIICSSFSF